jgi:hypothetical protein
MKKSTILGGFILFFLMSCGSPSESSQLLSGTEKIEVLKFETATKIAEAKREEIENSTKELQELLKEL